MFSRQFNQIRIDLSITPKGPLLIRRGRTGADPTRPDLECVRTSLDGRETVYVPGSSLKGVMRSHAESLLKTEGLAITDTFSRTAPQAFRQGVEGAEAYSGTCPLGRTFGNLHVKGRVGISDLLPGGRDPDGSPERAAQIDAANAVEQRNGVAIDRLLGSAKGGALFDQEVVVQGRFDGEIHLRNVQLYQLALVLLVLRDMRDGWVSLGSSTTRGGGRITAKIHSVLIEFPKSQIAQKEGGQLPGLASLWQDPAAQSYKLFRGDIMELPSGMTLEDYWIRQRLLLEGDDAIDSFAMALVQGPWLQFLDQARGQEWVA